MAQPFIGEIKIVPYNFAPSGWAFCNGQLLPISEYDTLFALIGTTYGGDGEQTFGLPDLRGRRPYHQGTGSGLSPVVMGQLAGSDYVTLTTNHLPQHTHGVRAVRGGELTAPNTSPAAAIWADEEVGAPQNQPYSTAAGSVPMSANAIAPTGGNQAHENRPPFLAVHFIISLFGVFPSRN